MTHRARFLGLLLVITSASLAAHGGPIPSASLLAPTAGESALTSFIVGPASSLHVDWMVIPTTIDFDTGLDIPGGAFAYLYQLENTTAVGVDAFSLTLGDLVFPTVISAGILAGETLDSATGFHQAHDAATFPILATEYDGMPLAPLSAVQTTLDYSDGTVSWTFGPQQPGTQADTFFLISTGAPTYGNAVAQDSTPPSPWGTLAPGADLVPVPVPEPGSLALLAMAALTQLRRGKQTEPRPSGSVCGKRVPHPSRSEGWGKDTRTGPPPMLRMDGAHSKRRERTIAEE